MRHLEKPFKELNLISVALTLLLKVYTQFCTCANNNIVTKTLSRRENTTNRQGVEQLRVLFGSSFLYFPLKVVGGHVRSRGGGGGSLAPAL